MGQSFAFAPGFTGMRCSSSDYGAGAPFSARASLSRPLFEYPSSRFTRSFPVTSPLCASSNQNVESMGGLRHGC
ncbi:hypothetical protein DBV23_03235 [Edwardsiella ictaluri]|nr:hypothetical protein B6E78_15550 [Edwardsiella ictaluri]AVZ81390.1 hypothetical protein DBV23_03235 [Edwardsiella ictaluri]WJH20476.1 hypothetical protein FGU63_04885 [Edwardsiella ictaluri]